MTTGDRYLAKTLSAYGVTHFFHMPLIVPNAMKIMELPEYGIKPISAHSEKAAAYMADGYARITGKPGICGSQGIGRSNLMAGLRDAYMARSPIIAITGGNSNNDENTDRAPYQEVDDISAFDPFTKFNANIGRLERLPDMLRQAFREATSGCPAPTHLQIPGVLGNVTMGKMDDDDIVQTRFSSVPPFRPAAEPGDVAAAIAALAAAERPVLVVGAGVKKSGAEDELRAFARKHQIPVASSMSGKDIMVDSDPLAVGVAGMYGRETAARVVHEADLVFYVGSMTKGLVTNHWTSPMPDTDVIQLDIDPHWLGRNYPNVASLCGDAKTVLQQLLDAAEPMAGNAEWVDRVAAIVAEWRESYADLLASDAQPIRPERVMRDLSAFLPDNAIVVSDTGHATNWTAQFLQLTSENQTYIRATGSLGWGLPAALGAKCAAPDRPVFAFTGDGGLYYHLTEIETAVRYGLNVVTIVNNNSSMNQATPVWQGDDEERLRHHWRYQDVNFANLATEMGAFGIRVTDPGQINDALAQAVASGLPAVVEIVSGLDGLPPGTWAPEPVPFMLADVGDAG